MDQPRSLPAWHIEQCRLCRGRGMLTFYASTGWTPIGSQDERTTIIIEEVPDTGIIEDPELVAEAAREAREAAAAAAGHGASEEAEDDIRVVENIRSRTTIIEGDQETGIIEDLELVAEAARGAREAAAAAAGHGASEEAEDDVRVVGNIRRRPQNAPAAKSRVGKATPSKKMAVAGKPRTKAARAPRGSASISAAPGTAAKSTRKEAAAGPRPKPSRKPSAKLASPPPRTQRSSTDKQQLRPPPQTFWKSAAERTAALASVAARRAAATAAGHGASPAPPQRPPPPPPMASSQAGKVSKTARAAKAKAACTPPLPPPSRQEEEVQPEVATAKPLELPGGVPPWRAGGDKLPSTATWASLLPPWRRVEQVEAKKMPIHKRPCP